MQKIMVAKGKANGKSKGGAGQNTKSGSNKKDEKRSSSSGNQSKKDSQRRDDSQDEIELEFDEEMGEIFEGEGGDDDDYQTDEDLYDMVKLEDIEIEYFEKKGEPSSDGMRKKENDATKSDVKHKSERFQKEKSGNRKVSKTRDSKAKPAEKIHQKQLEIKSEVKKDKNEDDKDKGNIEMEEFQETELKKEIVEIVKNADESQEKKSTAAAEDKSDTSLNDELSVKQEVKTIETVVKGEKSADSVGPHEIEQDDEETKQSTEAVEQTLETRVHIPPAYLGPAFDKTFFEYRVRIRPVVVHDLMQPSLHQLMCQAESSRFIFEHTNRALEMFASGTRFSKLMEKLLINTFNCNFITFEVERRQPTTFLERELKNKTMKVDPTDYSVVLNRVIFQQKNAFIRRTMQNPKVQSVFGSIKQRSLFLHNLPSNIDEDFLKALFPLSLKVGLIKVSHDIRSAVLHMKDRNMVHSHLIGFTNFNVDGRDIQMSALDLSQYECLERYHFNNPGTRPPQSVQRPRPSTISAKEAQRKEVEKAFCSLTQKTSTETKDSIGKNDQSPKSISKESDQKSVSEKREMSQSVSKKREMSRNVSEKREMSESVSKKREMSRNVKEKREMSDRKDFSSSKVRDKQSGNEVQTGKDKSSNVLSSEEQTIKDMERKEREKKEREQKERERVEREKKDRERREREQKERERERQKVRRERELGKINEMQKRKEAEAEKKSELERLRIERTRLEEQKKREKQRQLWDEQYQVDRQREMLLKELPVHENLELQRNKREIEFQDRTVQHELEWQKELEQQRELDIKKELEKQRALEKLRLEQMQELQKQKAQRLQKEKLLLDQERELRAREEAARKLKMIEEEHRRNLEVKRQQEQEIRRNKQQERQQKRREDHRMIGDERDQPENKRSRLVPPHSGREAMGNFNSAVGNQQAKVSYDFINLGGRDFHAFSQLQEGQRSQLEPRRLNQRGLGHVSASATSTQSFAGSSHHTVQTKNLSLQQSLEAEVAKQAEELKRNLALLEEFNNDPSMRTINLNKKSPNVTSISTAGNIEGLIHRTASLMGHQPVHKAKMGNEFPKQQSSSWDLMNRQTLRQDPLRSGDRNQDYESMFAEYEKELNQSGRPYQDFGHQQRNVRLEQFASGNRDHYEHPSVSGADQRKLINEDFKCKPGLLGKPPSAIDEGNFSAALGKPATTADRGNFSPILGKRSATAERGDYYGIHSQQDRPESLTAKEQAYLQIIAGREPGRIGTKQQSQYSKNLAPGSEVSTRMEERRAAEGRNIQHQQGMGFDYNQKAGRSVGACGNRLDFY